ncbi:MAG: DUF423 domain-containing protein [Gemmatimonadetes bacterium]|nr:DUF423 domain-containing protein [Gemmatimonadota bacterium]
MIFAASAARERQFLFWGAVSGFLTVALGAFGAHAVKDSLSAYHLGVFETGVRYQGMHALATIVAAWVSGRRSGTLGPIAGWCFLAGTVFFSGSLYTLALSGVGAWGAVTPIGGVLWLVGWACLALSAVKRRNVSVEIETEERISAS